MRDEFVTGGLPPEQANSQVAEQLRIVCRTVLDGLLVVDDTRRYLRVNEAAATLLGAPAEEIRKRRMEDFTPHEDRSKLEPFWADFGRRGAYEGSGELLRGDGSRRLVEYRATRDFAPGEHLFALRELQPGAATGARPQEERVRQLTAREREVLQLAAEGRSTREIAVTLLISPTTVKTHFEHIYKKLRVGDRVAAVAYGLRTGLIR
jgi:PAS domain S-box-containing protein